MGKFFTALFFSLLIITGSASAEVVTERQGTLNAPLIQGDYGITFKDERPCEENRASCEERAKAGDLDALFHIAMQELRTPYKEQQALKKLRYAADKDHLEAQALLGMISMGWENIPPNPEQARYWWEKAAAAGHDGARENLAVMHYYGDGGTQDHEKAAQLFLKSAETGSPKSQFYLGVSYFRGDGLPKDTEKAYDLLQEAAEGNYPTAQRVYGQALLSAGQMENAYLWIAQAAIQGDRQAFEGILKLEGQINDPERVQEMQQQALKFQEELKATSK